MSENVRVLDCAAVNARVDQKTTSPTILYSKTIPGGTLDLRNALRLSMQFGTCSFSSCPRDTVPVGIQEMAVVHCYNYNTGLPLGTIPNATGQFNYISSVRAGKESFVATVSAVSGFGVPYPAPGALQIIVGNGNNISVGTTTPLPGGIDPSDASFVGQTAQAGESGKSDERCFMFFMHDIDPPLGGTDTDGAAYFSYDAVSNNVKFFRYSTGGLLGRNWAKSGDRFWGIKNNSGGYIVRYDFSTGGLPVATKTDALWTDMDANSRDMHASASYLYFLYHNAGGSGTTTIFRLDLDTMDIIDSWDLGIVVSKFYMVNDDLFYLVYNGFAGSEPWKFHTFIPSTNTLTLLGDAVKSCIGATSSFQFDRGYFYINQNSGFGGGTTGLAKIGPVLCPKTHAPIGS